MDRCVSDLALLAPVPLVHLEDGQQVCTGMRVDRVAYGSRNWQFFEKLDALRGADCVDVYIYASHADNLHKVASWRARYVGHVRSTAGGLHPGGEKYRPPSTRGESDYWAVFWEVRDLKRLADPIPLTDLRGLDSDHNYDRGFLPEGPMLIEHP
jgi:hypothetical protein